MTTDDVTCAQQLSLTADAMVLYTAHLHQLRHSWIPTVCLFTVTNTFSSDLMFFLIVIM